MIVASDVGYSHTKVATSGKRTIFPSIVGEVQQAHYDLDLVRRNGRSGYIQVQVQDGSWLVGEAALEQSGSRSNRQDRGWIKTPEYLALQLAAITELTSSTGGYTIRLITGLPINYYGDHQCLEALLLGDHQVKRAPRPKSQKIEISKVVVLPQGLAAVLSEALDDKGKIRSGPIAEGTVGMIDIGGHTVNLATFKQLREIARQTVSINLGMWEPLTDIGRRINDAYPGQNLVDHEITNAVLAGKVKHFGQDYDISDIFDEVLRPFTRSILSEVTKIWGSAARFDSILLVGGGAQIVGPAVIAEYPHAQVVTNPQWANVEGYLKFGQRMFGG
jgi:plasmid segregation protein ParM